MSTVETSEKIIKQLEYCYTEEQDGIDVKPVLGCQTF